MPSPPVFTFVATATCFIKTKKPLQFIERQAIQGKETGAPLAASVLGGTITLSTPATMDYNSNSNTGDAGLREGLVTSAAGIQDDFTSAQQQHHLYGDHVDEEELDCNQNGNVHPHQLGETTASTKYLDYPTDRPFLNSEYPKYTSSSSTATSSTKRPERTVNTYPTSDRDGKSETRIDTPPSPNAICIVLQCTKFLCFYFLTPLTFPHRWVPLPSSSLTFVNPPKAICILLQCTKFLYSYFLNYLKFIHRCVSLPALTLLHIKIILTSLVASVQSPLQTLPIAA